ncbi:hypothetical protein L1887_53495 [Cichorium endivia]|nr:hypothetical protein L1887_53495 [Cichorium endivia]
MQLRLSLMQLTLRAMGEAVIERKMEQRGYCSILVGAAAATQSGGSAAAAMSSAYAKQKLKQSRDALAKKDWPAAADAATSVLEQEADNYNANVFLGLALLNQGKFDESEAAYIKATRDQPIQLLAWQGLQKFYDQRKSWDKLRDVLHQLLDLYNDAGDAIKCAETLQRLLALEREEGGRKLVIDTLSLLLPDSKYYDTLSSLEQPDQTQPEKTTTFEMQMAIHVNSLDVLLEMSELSEKWEADTIQKEADKRRMRLAGASKGKEALTNEVRLEVYSASRLPSLYEQILSHPKAADELRIEVEAKLLRHRLGLLTSFPPKQLNAGAAPTGTAAVDAKQQERQRQDEQDRQDAKVQLRDEILKLASGMVIIGLPDELAWEIDLEWRPVRSLVDLRLEQIRKFVSLFPRSGRTKAFRSFLLWIKDEQFLNEIKEEEKRTDSEIQQPQSQDDLLNLAIDGLEECPDSVLSHRIAATFYLLDRDFQSATEVTNSALRVVSRIENDSAVDLADSQLGISQLLLTALTHLHPPQHHARSSRLIDGVLEKDPSHIDTLLAKAYIDQSASRWESARGVFEKVRSIAASLNANDYRNRIERLLSLSPDPDQEAWIEMAWCDVNLGNLERAKSEMDTILERLDPISFQGATAELRAKLWWRLGQCLWLMDGEFRANPDHAFTAFITALKRNPAFAPAYTSLGLYYGDILQPPDLVRSSKCFQKAFELDAREDVAARRLAEGFAEEQEWDLVEVVARRTIEGEGGADAIGSGTAAAVQASRRHLSRNAWAWKAIGNVEIAKKQFEDAIMAFQIALRAEPDDQISWQRLGQAYALAGRHVAALKCFAKCLDIVRAAGDPSDDGWQAQYSIGQVHLELGNFSTAIDTFASILQVHPDELGVKVALSNAWLLSSRHELATGYVERAEISAYSAIRTSLKALLQHDRHLRSAWKIVADAVFHLSNFGKLHQAALLEEDGLGGLKPLLKLAAELETDAKLPSISIVTHEKLAGAVEGLSPFRLLNISVYLYKLRVVLNASDDNVAGSAWADLATALYRLSRAMLLPSSQAGLVATETLSVAEVAEAQSVQARLQAIGSIKEALRHEPGQEAYWLLLGNLTFHSSVDLAQHCFIRAIENAPRAPSAGRTSACSTCIMATVPFRPTCATNAADARITEATLSNAIGLRCPATLRTRPATSMRFTSRRWSAERLGQLDLAIDRISAAATLLEERYEATESAVVARQYAVAESNLGRIRLAAGDFDGAAAAFEAAIGLLDVADDEAIDDAEDGKIEPQVLEIAKDRSEMRFPTPARPALLRSSAISTLQLAKLLWAVNGSAGIEEVKPGTVRQHRSRRQLVHACSVDPRTGRVGLGSDDADLAEAAQAELEAVLQSAGADETEAVDDVVRVLVAIKDSGAEGGADALTLVHEAIQAALARRDRDQRALFSLHLVYLSHAVRLLERSGKEGMGEDQISQLLAYASLTQERFEESAPLFSEIENKRSGLAKIQAQLLKHFPTELVSSVPHPEHALVALAKLDAPWSAAA